MFEQANDPLFPPRLHVSIRTSIHWAVRHVTTRHDDVTKWKHFPRFYFICSWINGWVNNREAGDLRRHRAHYDVIVIKRAVLAGKPLHGGPYITFDWISLWMKNSSCRCIYNSIRRKMPFSAGVDTEELWSLKTLKHLHEFRTITIFLIHRHIENCRVYVLSNIIYLVSRYKTREMDHVFIYTSIYSIRR